MKRIHTLISVIIGVVLLASCSSIDVRQYSENEPQFDLFDYFSGQTRGWGVVRDRSGGLSRQFDVDIKGTIDEQGRLVLDEDFVWNDGEISKRIWTITRISAGEYRGEAPDVVGTATGTSAGNVLNWKYDLNIVSGDSTWKIRFDDWMYLQPDDILLNTATMTKFGFRVGSVTIAFKKQ